jgi:hypothetical protein
MEGGVGREDGWERGRREVFPPVCGDSREPWGCVEGSGPHSQSHT